MIDRQPFAYCAPHQCAFIALDGQQIAQHHGFLLLARFMRQRGVIIRFGVNLCI